jgi:branched-chain amino acid transport system ATP-binding protein
MGRPSYLLLDETAAGMSGPEAVEFSALICRIARDITAACF